MSGTLDPADKAKRSYEGNGLLVSVTPESWEVIAKLGGRAWHRFDKAEAWYLDVHSMSPALMMEVMEWALRQKLVEPC